jgi:UDP-glucose 4-epimerase
MKNKILITGVAGFIGSNLALKLSEKGYKVRGIDNLSYGKKEQIPKGVEFYKADIRSQEIYRIFKGMDFVFHLAAKNCINDCQDNPHETSDINITGSINVFNAAYKAGVRKVIYAESSAIYEGSTHFPTPETDESPHSFYAISKLCSSLFAKGYQEFFKLNFTGLRYFNVYGPRQDYRRTIPPAMSAFIIGLLRNQKPVIYGTGRKKRDFIYVDDINDFHILCLNNQKTDCRVFNLGSGKNYAILDIYKRISKLLNIKRAPVFKRDLPGEAQETLADIKAAKKLGWEPKISIDHGLAKMIEYIRNEIKEGRIN